jgi:hypothetical protein
MLDIAMERAHLAKADRGIAAGEERIRCQLLRVEAMRNSHLDLTQAEALLETFRQTLEVWRGHRGEILSAITRLEARSQEPG